MINETIVQAVTADNLLDLAARGILRDVVDGQWAEQDEAVTGELHGAIQTYLIYLKNLCIVSE